MDLIKSYEFFKPENVTGQCHIIGCGSVGSYVATFLARSGIKNIVLWDFDKVESANIVNQMFYQKHVGLPKVDALRELILAINPDANVQVNSLGWRGERLSGYVFLCVDSIQVRKEIAEAHAATLTIKAMFDFRTGLTNAQHFAADFRRPADVKMFLRTLDITDEEAAASTPVSACGATLGVATTVAVVSAIGVDNFINFINKKELRRFVDVDAFVPHIEAF